MTLIVACDGNASYDSASRQITWIPTVKSNLPREESVVDKVTTIWNLNAAELVYKVRLTVEKEGFNSCADNMNSAVGDPQTYAVNNSATLTYNNSETAIFPIPYVRGLLYELRFRKSDSEELSKGLTGAVFTLESDDGKSYTATDGGNGEYCFSGIPWGNYRLTETTPPAGYQTGSVSSWKVTVGYTLDLQDGTLEIDKHTHEADSVYYRWIGYYTEDSLGYDQNNVWTILNEKKNLNVIFKKVSASDTAIVLKGAEFELFNSDRQSLGTMTSGEDGLFWPEGYELTSGIYYLKETKAPSGYLLLSDEIELTITEDEEDKITVNSDHAFVEKTAGEDGQEIYTVTVKNEVVYELPSTGGNGILRYIIGGVLLIMAAALILYKNKSREVFNA